jgi:transposase
MNKGKFVFAQLMTYVNDYEFSKCVDRYQGDYRIRDLSCWNQFLYMAFGQITHRESISDIITCLNAHQKNAYHLGIKQVVVVSTLTRANENRDWRIYADFAQYLLGITRPLYIDDNDFKVDIDNTVYALDSTTIDLCLSVFVWAKFRKHKAAVKLHTMLDLRGDLPTFIDVTDGKTHDLNILDRIIFEPGAFYIMDKGYIDFKRLYNIHQAPAFFVIRAKDNLKFKRIKASKIDKKSGLRCDQTIELAVTKSKEGYPDKLRRVKYYDSENDLMMVFITNNFAIEALDVANLYHHRWRIELFFKWIKQHLRIKKFWGYSSNAVKTQIWIAVCIYLLVAYVKATIKTKLTLYEMLQILSVSVFDKTAINELLTNMSKNENILSDCNQLNLFEF